MALYDSVEWQCRPGLFRTAVCGRAYGIPQEFSTSAGWGVTARPASSPGVAGFKEFVRGNLSRRP